MSTSTTIRLLLVDDHAVMRAGLRLLIDAQPDMETIGEAENGFEALVLAEALCPDIVLLDLSMPKVSGLSILRDLQVRVPQAQVLVLTVHAEAGYLQEALRQGAVGYVVKSAADQELLAAIRTVARGDVYIHSSMTRSLLDALMPAAESAESAGRDSWDDLSEREQQVVRGVAWGYTNREIAERLHLSTKTVETYRARGMAKLGLRSRAQLVEYAVQRGLLELDDRDEP